MAQHMSKAPRGLGVLRHYYFSERNEMRNFLIGLWRDEEGQDLTEYALLVVLVALAAIGAMRGLAGAIGNAFNNAVSGLSSAASGGGGS